jgi:hypothetical protein
MSDGQKRSAEEAYRFFTETQGFHSWGTLTLTVEAFEDYGIEVFEDEMRTPEDPHDDPAHVVADFRKTESWSSGQKEKLASSLSGQDDLRSRPCRSAASLIRLRIARSFDFKSKLFLCTALLSRYPIGQATR